MSKVSLNGCVLKSAQTKERTVLYYKEILPSGEATPDFVDTIKINNNVIDSVDKTVTEYKPLD